MSRTEIISVRTMNYFLSLYPFTMAVSPTVFCVLPLEEKCNPGLNPARYPLVLEVREKWVVSVALLRRVSAVKCSPVVRIQRESTS